MRRLFASACDGWRRRGGSMRVGALARRLPARGRLARLFGVEVALVAVEALVGSEAGRPLAAVRAPCALVAAGRPLGAVDAPSIARNKEFDQCLWDFLFPNCRMEKIERDFKKIHPNLGSTKSTC